MPRSIYPERYVDLLPSQSKELAVVLQIDGVTDLLATTPIYEKVRYGDPGILYGTPGLVYGALRVKENCKPYLQVDGNLTIGQKIEPEQGRGGISTLSLNFIDKDGYMSRLISPGVVIDEPLGNKAVKVWVGFVNSSFPDDYSIVFRGFISGTYSSPAKVTIKLSDPNFKRKGQVFLGNPSDLTAAMSNVDTSVTVSRTDGFYNQIPGPSGVPDTSVTTYLKIGDEVMTYPFGGIISSTVVNVLRGSPYSRGTLPVAHNIGDSAINGIQLQGNPIDLALKMMLSGWNGPFVSNVVCNAIGVSGDPNIPNRNDYVAGIPTIDLEVEYGITAGDYVTISGSGAGNNGTYKIVSVLDAAGYTSNLLQIDTFLTPEAPATGVTLAFRSRYDVLPVGAGLKMRPAEVDVATHEYVRDVFVSDASYRVQLYYTTRQQGKEQIEKELFLPFGIYSLTRYGRVSCGITKPPIADEKFLFITPSVVINPQNIKTERAVDNRRYFNQVVYSYDRRDDGVYGSVQALIDSESLSLSTVASPLPIQSSGLKSALGAQSVINNRGNFILNRYKNCATEITLTIFWRVGAQIEVGDVVVLQDNGALQVTNFATGTRDLGAIPWEVFQRSMNLKDGNVTITLLNQLGFNVDDRYAGISPSSEVVAGSTTTRVKFKDSFGVQFPGNEKKKWERFGGQTIRVHSPDYTRDASSLLIGVDPGDSYALLLAVSLPFTPLAGDIIEVDNYSLTNTNPDTNKLTKTLYCSIDPTLTVVSGASTTQFDVSPSDAALLIAGQKVFIHNDSYSVVSPEIVVSSVVGTTITLATPLTFTPSAGQKVELVGFVDGGGPYRMV